MAQSPPANLILDINNQHLDWITWRIDQGFRIQLQNYCTMLCCLILSSSILLSKESRNWFESLPASPVVNRKHQDLY